MIRVRAASLLVLLALSGLALTAPLAPTVAAAAVSVPPVMLVVDVSGSMADDDGSGTIKLDGAKTALGAFLSELPDGTTAGMRAYPMGSGDCGSGKAVWKPEPLLRSRLGAEVRSLRADGGTPTAQALLAARGDLLNAGYSRGTIVLVSDGESNCVQDGPVCDVAADLSSREFPVTVHTVGFNISEAGRSELECIARATDGVYSDVQGAAQLAGRLNDLATGRLDLDVTAPATVRMTVGASDPAGRRVRAVVTNPGVREAVDVRVTLQMVAPALGDVGQSFIATSQPTRLLGTLEPGGRREVEWEFRPPIDFSRRTLSYRVLAGPAGATATEATGTIVVSSEFNLRDAGPLLADKKQVVILGDSYSAGEGAQQYEPETDTKTNTCHRSRRTYAMDLFPNRPVVLACSGAIAANITGANPVHTALGGSGTLPAQTAQLQALIDAGTVPDLALISLGGNDVGFAGIILQCVATPRNCTRGPKSVVGPAREKVAGLPAGLTAAYGGVQAVLNSPAAVKSRGGAVAPIVVLAYPQLFPNEVGKAARCQGYLEGEEIAFANTLGREINSTIGVLIESLRRSQELPVYFASDVEEALLPDHTMCGAAPWANEINVTKTTTATVAENDELILAVSGATVQTKVAARAIVGGAQAYESMSGPELRAYKEAYHPTAEGYQAMTAALVRYSGSADANTPVPPAPLSGAKPGPLQGAPIVLQGSTTAVLNIRPEQERPLEVRGLPAGTAVEVVLRSAPVVLAHAISDEAGTVRTTVTVPAGVPPGRHELQVVTLEDGQKLLSQRLQLQRLRPWWWLPGGVVSGLFLIGGTATLSRRRTLQSREQPAALA